VWPHHDTTALDTNRLVDVPKILASIIEPQAWKRWRWIGSEFSAATIAAYVTHPPKRLGATTDLIRRPLADHPKVLDQFEQELRADEAERRDLSRPQQAAACA
jgi:hypothetical protein